MRLFDRDRVWTFAWAMVPVALLANLVFGSAYEQSMRLAYQAAADAEAGDWPKALGRYEQAAEVAPGSAAMAHNVSVAYYELGDPRAALDWNREALRRDPAFAAALEARPKLVRATARAPRAERAAQRDSATGVPDAESTIDTNASPPTGSRP